MSADESLNPQQFVKTSSALNWRSGTEGTRVRGRMAAKRQSPQYAALRDDIAVNGIQTPITRHPNGAIVNGHHRVAAAQELGITHIPWKPFVVATSDPKTWGQNE